MRRSSNVLGDDDDMNDDDIALPAVSPCFPLPHRVYIL
jgi:hypothetical protein